jgi:hypothetical protein
VYQRPSGAPVGWPGWCGHASGRVANALPQLRSRLP